MKRFLAIVLIITIVFSLCACGIGGEEETRKRRKKETSGETVPVFRDDETGPVENTDGTYAATESATTQPATQATGVTTATQTTEATTQAIQQPEQPTHSSMYIPDIAQEDVVRWFNEVCLDAEFVNSGNATLVQKWSSQVRYALTGAPTDEDKAALADMASFMNSIPGFPGMYEVSDPASANMTIHFVSEDEMINILGNNFYGCDGGVTFWYNGANEIYSAKICVRTDIDQFTRNSVIKEEIYNGMGPVQDTDLRTDSLIYSGYSTPQYPTQVDKLIMSLLYSPKVRCGMNMTECDAILCQLYY